MPPKTLAARHNLPPRHLEPMLQALVRAGILKGVRGPRGGYELARERRRITAGDIVRVAMTAPARTAASAAAGVAAGRSWSSAPLVERGTRRFWRSSTGVTVEDLCRQAHERRRVQRRSRPAVDFTI